MAFFNDTSMYGIGEDFVISELIDTNTINKMSKCCPFQ